MIKFFGLLFLIVFISGLVNAQNFLVGKCMVFNSDSGNIIHPENIDLINGYQYKHFKPSVANELNKIKPYFTPETNVSLYSGVSYKKLVNCEKLYYVKETAYVPSPINPDNQNEYITMNYYKIQNKDKSISFISRGFKQ